MTGFYVPFEGNKQFVCKYKFNIKLDSPVAFFAFVVVSRIMNSNRCDNPLECVVFISRP